MVGDPGADRPGRPGGDDEPAHRLPAQARPRRRGGRRTVAQAGQATRRRRRRAPLGGTRGPRGQGAGHLFDPPALGGEGSSPSGAPSSSPGSTALDRGRRTVNAVPPAGLGAAVTVPPCALTIDATMESPNPAPP